jgi:hypothetical protein
MISAATRIARKSRELHAALERDVQHMNALKSIDTQPDKSDRRKSSFQDRINS